MNAAITHKKILFTGSVNAGKTTAIKTISDIPIVSTHEKTTVAMDYGCISIANKEKIHLYGTPGWERFNFMRNILIEGVTGLILLLDNSRNDPKQDLIFYLHVFREFIQEDNLIIGITWMDKCKTPSINDYRQWLDDFSISAPVFTVDARERQDVSLLVQALLYSLNPEITGDTSYVL